MYEEIASKSAEEAIKIAQKKKDQRQARQITFNDSIDDRPAVITFNGSTLGTRGEVCSIVSTEGTGKSHICEAICTTRTKHVHDIDADCIGFDTEMSEVEHILYIDTERTTSDLLNGMRRILNRTKIKYEVIKSEEQMNRRIVVPEEFTTERNTLRNIDFYAMKQLSPKKRREEIELLLAANEQKYALIILDGITDICTDPNSMEEAQEIMANLGAIAEQYALCILCTIHRNAGQDTFERGRGHIGAELKRKASGQLSIEKDKTDKNIRVINAQKVRNATDDISGAYKWCDKAHMFMSCETPESPKSDRPLTTISPDDYSDDFHKGMIGKLGGKGVEIKNSAFKEKFGVLSKSIYGANIKNPKKVVEFCNYFIDRKWAEISGNTKGKTIKFI